MSDGHVAELIRERHSGLGGLRVPERPSILPMTSSSTLVVLMTLEEFRKEELVRKRYLIRIR